jgi:hypothetical protein
MIWPKKVINGGLIKDLRTRLPNRCPIISRIDVGIIGDRNDGERQGYWVNDTNS